MDQPVDGIVLEGLVISDIGPNGNFDAIKCSGLRNLDKWIFRVLQETKAEGFPPCRNVVISGNSFVFQRAKVREELNIGPDTAPETFKFENNRWFAADQPEASKPKLPVVEKGGRYGVRPE